MEAEKNPVPDRKEPEPYGRTAYTKAKLVPLENSDRFDIRMQYPLLHMQHAEKDCLVREEVKERLMQAAMLLPAGYKLRIYDAWRPFALQQELYEKYSADILLTFGMENAAEEEKNALIRKFVSQPVKDTAAIPVHTTGGAVDLTILDADGRELEMGTGFDAFTEKTHTAFFETGEDMVIRDNRRLLYHVMQEAGFTNLPSEWWHYDYGDRFWAYYRSRPAIYDGIFERE